MKDLFKKTLISLAVVVLGIFFYVGSTLAAPNPVNGGIVPCGVTGQRMCTLCDMISGMNDVMQYVMKIAIGLGILAFTIGGVMYAISAGEKGLIDMAKGTMKNAAIGFIIIFSAWLIVNTTIQYIGTKDAANSSSDGNGMLGLGIRATSWGNFECLPPVTQATTNVK